MTDASVLRLGAAFYRLLAAGLVLFPAFQVFNADPGERLVVGLSFLILVPFVIVLLLAGKFLTRKKAKAVFYTKIAISIPGGILAHGILTILAVSVAPNEYNELATFYVQLAVIEVILGTLLVALGFKIFRSSKRFNRAGELS